jgi:hypothetical protein
LSHITDTLQSHQSSPRRKGKNRKRLGPSSPSHNISNNNPAASTGASRASASGNFKEQPLQGRALDYNASPFVPQGNTVIHAPSGSYDSAAAAARCAKFYRAAAEVA